VTGYRSAGLVRWNGRRWQQVAGLPAVLRNSSLGSVLARSDHDVWLGGAVRNAKAGTTEAIGHWNGRSWTVRRLPAPAARARDRVVSLAGDGAGGIWALGACLGVSCPGQRSRYRLWHETGGRWSGPVRPRLGTGMVGLFSLAGAGHSVWAVGIAVVGRNTDDGLIARWRGVRPR